jgi:hypothetical protein
MANRGILDRIGLNTRVVVQRGAMSAGALAGTLRDGVWEPEGGEACELEAGGQVLARGAIVRRKSAWYFKAIEVAKGGGA